MLATHVVNANGVPDLDRDNFKQLLAEVLSTDEEGQPNLGTDVTVNHKLICIIYQVGIEPNLIENPFKTSGTGKADSQLASCLEAIQLAVEKTPHVLFLKSEPQGGVQSVQTPPLYFWLISRLVQLLASTPSVDVRHRVISLIEMILQGDRKCSPNQQPGVITDFLRALISGERIAIVYCILLSSYRYPSTHNTI